MADKRIRFTAEEDVTPLIKRLRQESEQLGRDLIRDSRTYTTSGKEALQYIEQQIRAIERRGRVDRESRLAELEISRARGGVAQGTYQSRVSDIKAGGRTDELQVSLLRELIETVKSQSQREIIEDRKNVEKSIKSSKTVDELDPGGDELRILKESVQRQKLGDIKAQEVSEKEQFKYGRVLQSGAGVIGGAAGSRNQFYALAAGLALIPFVGQAASGLATKALSSAENYQTGLAGMSQLTGSAQSRFYGAGGDLTNIGYTKADFLNLNRRAAIAGGGYGGSVQSARDIAFLERGTGFSADMFLQQERLGMAGGLGARGGTQRFVRGLQAGGMMQGQDVSLLGEYLPLLISLQQEQVKIAGETNTNIASKLVTGIASLDESFKNPDVLRGVLPSIMGGARRPASAQVEALQFRALSRLNPGASLMDLEAARENPNMDYIQGLFEQLQSVSPNQEIFARNLRGTFGLSSTQALKAAAGFGKKGFNMGDEAKQVGLANIQERAGVDFGTGDLRAGTARFTEKFETVGQALTDVIQSLVGVMPELKEGLEKFTETIVQAEKDRKVSVDALLQSESRLERVMGMLAGSRPIGYGPG